jgi:nucleoside-triphosphatase THEP1
VSAAETPTVWRRAAVYGSLWAASEIVVGSFLHNLRIPFAGSLLAAFGVLVMTAGHRTCPERGLIWRSAVVCALMKSLSPSAVILGPMIGIAMEGVLLEACVRATGGRAVGYLAGGAMAVTWALVQRVLNALIAFGPDVVRLYVEAYGFASRALGVSRFGPFDLIAVLVVVECAIGIGAAALGLRVAGRATAASAGAAPPQAPDNRAPLAPIEADGAWSLPRLGAASGGLLAGMIVLTLLPLWAGAMYVAVYAAAVLRTYPRAASRIRRLSLWVELTVVMLLAGLLLGGARGGAAGLTNGLAAGAAMVLRAVLVLFGFSAVSVELRNPRILSWVERRRLRGLSDALGVAFSTLPVFTATIARPGAMWRRPGRLASVLIAQANATVRGVSGGGPRRRVFVLTGDTGSGKSTIARGVVDDLRTRGIRVAGILAPGLLENGRRTGFDILNLATGESAELAREHANPNGPHPQWSRFAFSPAGLALGEKALGQDAGAADIVVIDEVGPFELAGGGWASALDSLAHQSGRVMLLVVRRSVVDAVTRRWGSADTVIWDVAETSGTTIVNALAVAASEGRSFAGSRDPTSS